MGVKYSYYAIEHIRLGCVLPEFEVVLRGFIEALDSELLSVEQPLIVWCNDKLKVFISSAFPNKEGDRSIPINWNLQYFRDEAEITLEPNQRVAIIEYSNRDPSRHYHRMMASGEDVLFVTVSEDCQYFELSKTNEHYDWSKV